MNVVTVPDWLFSADLHLDDKWVYVFLLKLRAELCGPGHNALVLPLEDIGKRLDPLSLAPASYLRSALEMLAKAKIIYARRMDYPKHIPEAWEIGFLKEERL